MLRKPVLLTASGVRPFTQGFWLLCAAGLAGCGGGGGGGGGSTTGGGTAAPAPTPSLPVTLSAVAADVNLDEGQTAAFSFTATYSGSTSQPVVADIAIGSKRYALDGTASASGNSFVVPLKTIAFSPGGKDSTMVTVRLCTTASCTTVYPGSTSTFTVNLDVRLKDWGTFQRDAAHTGYVAVNYKTADFAEAWNLINPPSNSTNASIYGPTPIAARRGSVFFNRMMAAATSSTAPTLQTFALNSATGVKIWSYDLGTKGYYGAPSYANGRVISAAMDISSSNIPMDVIDADKGTYLRSLFYPSQFAQAGTPTPLGDNLYHAAGYFGNQVYGYDAALGTRQWVGSAVSGVVQEGESVAADESFVYFFSAGSLFALSRTTGAIVHRIVNPFFSRVGLSYYGSYFGAPILDGSGRVFTFSDNRGPAQALPLVAFSVNNDTVLWRSSQSYSGEPALSGGKLYAIRSNSAVVDIINTADGSVLGSIDLGSDKGTLNSNVVVTNSHLFVANATATYAIDLQQASFPVVWSAQHGGSLAITPDNALIISGITGLYAYRLS